jgi:hypothetical protein
VTRGNEVHAGAVTRSTVALWGLADGKLLPVSNRGALGWHRAGRGDAGLTLAAARRGGSERQRRRRGGSRRRGREGSIERWGSPVAHGGGEGGGCDAASERRKSRHGEAGGISVSGGGVPFLKGLAGGGIRGGGVGQRGRRVEEAGHEQGVPADRRAAPGRQRPKAGRRA